jgi:hypothetical protein
MHGVTEKRRGEYPAPLSYELVEGLVPGRSPGERVNEPSDQLTVTLAVKDAELLPLLVCKAPLGSVL